MRKGAAACINAGLWEEGYPRNNAVLEKGAAAAPLEENIRLSAVLARRQQCCGLAIDDGEAKLARL